MSKTAEHQRLQAHHDCTANWRLWGPYLSERAWGTVREDYSVDGDAWHYFPHDYARSRAYRWNEDGLAGISDRNQYLCFAVALWNERDAILKERLFGLTNAEGNHGEDVKEIYYYLDNTPTHSYMKMLYKYPQRPFPYDELVEENARRGFYDYEYELIDTESFVDNRYFDLFVEYAKADQDDMLIRITAINRGPDPATCHILPTLWFRNTWSWGYEAGPMGDVKEKPVLEQQGGTQAQDRLIAAHHSALGDYFLHPAGEVQQILFTENETNTARLHNEPGPRYSKDAFHRYFVEDAEDAVNPERRGTKAAIHYRVALDPGAEQTVELRLSTSRRRRAGTDSFRKIFQRRLDEADDFYNSVQSPALTDEGRALQRQAFAGLLWSKQLYYLDIRQWVLGDPLQPRKAEFRNIGRNYEWIHLTNFDVISMPDKWEYPWYATWDLGFHCLPLALIDPDYAKRQLELLTREWYMHPNGALPAYEWSFGDANPPVSAWAAWRVYKIESAQMGRVDRAWLEGVFHKLMLNFTWWVNRKDEDGHNIFQGGFLGLDNISVFDRSAHLPTGGHIDQSDGTAWMAFYSLMMMKIALELACENPIYQDTATKFFEHFLRIANAMANCGGRGHALWDEEDGFFYDMLHLPDDSIFRLRVRSLVGLMPLIAVETLEPDLLESMPTFERRMQWFIDHRPTLGDNVASVYVPGAGKRRLTAILSKEQLVSLLRYMLDENEFLSDFGIRSVSKYHATEPYEVSVGGKTFTVRYQLAESRSGLYGGNSNWRGPIWFPINYLIIEGLQRFHHYYGDEFTVEYPTHSGNQATLAEIAADLSQRLIRLFLRNEDGERPLFGGANRFQHDPHWRDYIFFYEYFHGDNGAGLGASHQTGWTGLVAKLLQQSGDTR